MAPPAISTVRAPLYYKVILVEAAEVYPESFGQYWWQKVTHGRFYYDSLGPIITFWGIFMSQNLL